MDAQEQQHALKGRQKLEEVRRKKAAAAAAGSGQVLTTPFFCNSYWVLHLSSSICLKLILFPVNPNRKTDLLLRLKLHLSQLQTVESERNLLQRQWEESVLQIQNLSDELNQSRSQSLQEMATLRKSLESSTMERDAAIVSREDMVAQVRLLKRRLQETEDEQYKAEEDAAALRAELKLLHHSDQQADNTAASSEQLRSAEQEISSLKQELQELARRLQQEQQTVASERLHVSALTIQNRDLQTELVAANQKIYECNPLQKDKVKNQLNLAELASMVERQEQGRQKLLAEIDAQSLEIERLFLENEGLRDSLKESNGVSARWDRQVQECLEQNGELRAQLNQLREEQITIAAVMPKHPQESFVLDSETGTGAGNEGTLQFEARSSEEVKLKRELVKAQAHAEELSARVIQQSADLNRAVQALTSLSSLYKPVLSSIENRLLQLQQDSYVPDTMYLGF
ncbi:unnamed protein product [Sphagnum jensenii]|uniref:Uncharacterized protein n=1 Tax=Sphagnum jensenii TaxID=128206 RepID=A0ABP1AUH4_9BRYO